ncbi:hypothetical protein OAE91_03395 [Akkermansiaceae bacterium]|nr:hypothetical protein [Akkermansiaceae bacterium]
MREKRVSLIRKNRNNLEKKNLQKKVRTRIKKSLVKASPAKKKRRRSRPLKLKKIKKLPRKKPLKNAPGEFSTNKLILEHARQDHSAVSSAALRKIGKPHLDR